MLYSSSQLPENFNEFLDTLLFDHSSVFENYFSDFVYLLKAGNYQQLIKQGEVELWTWRQSPNENDALIIARSNPTYRRMVVFLQYLNAHRHVPQLYQFLTKLFQQWKDHHVDEVICDSPFIPSVEYTQLCTHLEALEIPRVILVKELSSSSPIPTEPGPHIRMLLPETEKEVANCLFRAYELTPWKVLHPEIRREDDFSHFFRNVFSEFFPLVLGYHVERELAGVIVGSTVLPDVAIVFHLGVLPSFRRQGIATHLLRTWIHLMYSAGVEKVFLWTHRDNPALQLYINEGFQIIHSYPAIYWCRKEH